MFRNLCDFPGVASGEFVSEVFESTVPAKQMLTGRHLVVPTWVSKRFIHPQSDPRPRRMQSIVIEFI